MMTAPHARFPQAHKLPKAIRARLISAVIAALKTNNAAVERAITVLFDRQTREEQCVEETICDNSLGVRSNHGKKIAYYGKWIASGRHLTGYHLEKARNIALTYAKTQLFELAALKAGLIKE